MSENYDALSNHAIDALVARALWPEDWDEIRCRAIDKLVKESDAGQPNPYVFGSEGDCPECGELRVGRRILSPYSTDDNAARLVRNRIAELGLIAQYQRELAEQVWPIGTDQYSFAFRMEQATPQQQCVAAIRAIESRAKEGE